MTAGERRALNAREIVIARDVFANQLDYTRIRIRQLAPLGFGAMVPLGQTILFSRFRAARDFSAASLPAQGLFVHELTHCWQAARGTVLALAKLSAIGAAAYRYALTPGKPFAAYNIEQQAEIVRHLFLARAGRPERDAPARAALEALWAQR